METTLALVSKAEDPSKPKSQSGAFDVLSERSLRAKRQNRSMVASSNK